MKVLLVDNGTSYLSELQKLLSPAMVDVVPLERTSARQADRYDLVILSGGHKFTVITHKDKYAKELALITGSTTPIIGICLSFELIVVAFGGRLKLLRRKIRRNVAITFTHSQGDGHPKIVTVFENHQRGVKGLPPSLEVVARSSNGVEIIRHVDRPIYGFQFHPEIGESGQGSLIISDAINILLRPIET